MTERVDVSVRIGELSVTCADGGGTLNGVLFSLINSCFSSICLKLSYAENSTL